MKEALNCQVDKNVLAKLKKKRLTSGTATLELTKLPEKLILPGGLQYATILIQGRRKTMESVAQCKK